MARPHAYTSRKSPKARIYHVEKWLKVVSEVGENFNLPGSTGSLRLDGPVLILPLKIQNQ